ncbi:hypothetical protein ABIA39_004642 [Nocardia sp. GAS34]|uniref:hypothetical protein n=1 Tax=unclassified Nocardia TaxID=2637762 RepID=UPI003D24BAF1
MILNSQLACATVVQGRRSPGSLLAELPLPTMGDHEKTDSFRRRLGVRGGRGYLAGGVAVRGPAPGIELFEREVMPGLR